MTKTIKVCDKCGKECGKERGRLFRVPFMSIKGHKIEVMYDTEMGTAYNEYCEECTRKIVDKVNDIVLGSKF